MRRPSWYTVAAILLSSIVTASVALVVAVRVNAESDRKWCSVVTTLDDAWTQTPPTTPAGQNLARDFHELRQRLDCPAK